MADLTTQQKEYDAAKAAVDALKGIMGMESVYKTALAEFNKKYPDGRPKELTTADVAAGIAATGINLGIGEALLNDPIYGPGLKKVFDLYKAGKKTEALDELNKTPFAKLSSDARNRYITKVENSDLYKEGLNAWKISLKSKLKSQGIDVTDAQLDDYYLKGTPEIAIIDELRKGTKFAPGKTGGTAADTYNSLLRTATRNGISIDMLPKVLGYDTVDEVIKDIQTGESIDALSQRIRNYAKTAMPDNVKRLIDEGNDLTDIVAPYKSTIAEVLELPYNSVDVTDKYIQGALANNMTLTDLRKALRKDDRWQYTDAAHSEVANATKKVLQDFGFMG